MNTQIRKKIDLKGKKIYVGIDVHKKKWTIAICSEHTNYRPFNQDANSDRLVNYLRQHYPGATIICAYEAGFSGFYLQEHLTENGIQCLVVHPADIPTTDKESEFKTDIRDAKKIAECLRSGQLRSIHIPNQTITRSTFFDSVSQTNAKRLCERKMPNTIFFSCFMELKFHKK